MRNTGPDSVIPLLLLSIIAAVILWSLLSVEAVRPEVLPVDPALTEPAPAHPTPAVPIKASSNFRPNDESAALR